MKQDYALFELDDEIQCMQELLIDIKKRKDSYETFDFPRLNLAFQTLYLRIELTIKQLQDRRDRLLEQTCDEDDIHLNSEDTSDAHYTNLVEHNLRKRFK